MGHRAWDEYRKWTGGGESKRERLDGVKMAKAFRPERDPQFYGPGGMRGCVPAKGRVAKNGNALYLQKWPCCHRAAAIICR